MPAVVRLDHKVYVIRFEGSDKFYVGYTRTTIARRMQAHLKTARSGRQYPLGNAIRKYRKFKVRVVGEFATKEEAFRREQELIAKYRGRLYNVSKGGECFPDWAIGAYWKRGKSDEQIADINRRKGRAGRSNPFFGHTHSAENMAKAVATRRARGSYDGSASQIRVVYCGQEFSSKRELQRQLGMTRWTFDRKFNAGEIRPITDEAR